MNCISAPFFGMHRGCAKTRGEFLRRINFLRQSHPFVLAAKRAQTKTCQRPVLLVFVPFTRNLYHYYSRPISARRCLHKEQKTVASILRIMAFVSGPFWRSVSGSILAVLDDKKNCLNVNIAKSSDQITWCFKIACCKFCSVYKNRIFKNYFFKE